MLAFPYFFFLEMVGPVIEALGYVAFVAALIAGQVNQVFMVAFFMVAIVLGVALSISAVALEELSFRRYPRFRDLVELFILGVLENFGYRQLNQWWRVKGTWSALRGVEGWGSMTRKGFSPDEGEETQEGER